MARNMINGQRTAAKSYKSKIMVKLKNKMRSTLVVCDSSDIVGRITLVRFSEILLG